MDRATTAKIIYWLYLAGLFFGVPILIGLAWAYMEKEKNISDIQHSHFDQQFFIGWTTVLGFIVWIILPIGDGMLIVIPWFWCAFMSWKGHRALVNGLPAKTVKIGAGSEGVVTASAPVQASVPASKPAPAENVEASDEAPVGVSAVAGDAGAKVQEAFDKHWPEIKAKVQKQIAKMGKKASELDDKMWEKVFRIVHGQLPFPVRIVLKKDRFISYCMKNKDKLL